MTIVVIRMDRSPGLGQMVPSSSGRIAGVAGLFEQLASAGGARIFAGSSRPPGVSRLSRPRPGTELADHHHLLIGRHGHDMNAVGQMGDVEVMDLAALARPEPLAPQAKQPVSRPASDRGRPRRR